MGASCACCAACESVKSKARRERPTNLHIAIEVCKAMRRVAVYTCVSTDARTTENQKRELERVDRVAFFKVRDPATRFLVT
jgi:hypothetical protein